MMCFDLERVRTRRVQDNAKRVVRHENCREMEGIQSGRYSVVIVGSNSNTFLQLSLEYYKILFILRIQ